MAATKPEWAQHLPHGPEILLLQSCETDGDNKAQGRALLCETNLGQAGKALPVLWGLEMLAQTAAALPVNGDPAGPREGYLVKADSVSFQQTTLPLDEPLITRTERLSQGVSGLYICQGEIVRENAPDVPLFSARFFLWNKAAVQSA
jgi:predicted hotdog family 3-hydroxylacyl-ACP dehydratase